MCGKTPNIYNNLTGLIGNANSASPYTTCPAYTTEPGTSCIVGQYWSSTEDSVVPVSRAYVDSMTIPANYHQPTNKKFQLAVRCVRPLTF